MIAKNACGCCSSTRIGPPRIIYHPQEAWLWVVAALSWLNVAFVAGHNNICPCLFPEQPDRTWAFLKKMKKNCHAEMFQPAGDTIFSQRLSAASLARDAPSKTKKLTSRRCYCLCTFFSKSRSRRSVNIQTRNWEQTFGSIQTLSPIHTDSTRTR